MKKVLYYVVELQLQDIDGIQETTGWKTITVYTVEKGKIVKWFDIETANTGSSTCKISDWLTDNGYGDESIKMILL